MEKNTGKKFVTQGKHGILSRLDVATLFRFIDQNNDHKGSPFNGVYFLLQDSTSFNTNRKKVDSDYKQLTQQISGLLSKLKNEGSDATEKVT